MRWRSVPNHAASAEAAMRAGFLFSSADAHVKADHAVLVPRSYRRKIPREVILALDDLLVALRHIRAVGKRNVIGELLLDGDLRTARRGIGFRGQALRIDLDAAGSKQLLDAAADGRVDRLVDDQGRGFIGERAGA